MGGYGTQQYDSGRGLPLPALHEPPSRDPRAPHSAAGPAGAERFGAPPAPLGPTGQVPAYKRGASEPLLPPHVAPRPAPAAPAPLPHLEEQKMWFYQDPKGIVHGPHSIAQFRRWLDSLAQRPDMREDYLAFRAVSVFKQDGGAGVPLSMLLG